MSTTKTDLFLITGIPGTGKTWYGDRFAREFGFVHRDLEVVPGQMQTSLVLQFREAGFKLIWFDGNRPAALSSRSFASGYGITPLEPCRACEIRGAGDREDQPGRHRFV